jgi:hypothetical protein
MPCGTVGRIKRSGNHCKTWAVRPNRPPEFPASNRWISQGEPTLDGTFSGSRGSTQFPQIRRSEDIPLITTDGFEFYERVIGQVFGSACIYGQVIKTRRNNRIVKVERRAVIGTEGRFEERLQRSEDSSTLNTSFIERLNLTIRQGSAYLCRRTICHGPLQATSGRSFGIAAVLLQLRQTPSGAEIRAGASDAGHSSWIDQEAADAAEDLLFGNGLPRIMRNPAGVRLLCNIILC